MSDSLALHHAWLAYQLAVRARRATERRDDRITGTPAHDFRRPKTGNVISLDDHR